MAQPISVNYAALEHANQQMVAISGRLDEKLDTIRAFLQRLDWEGDDREAYRTQQNIWDAAVVDINKVLNEIGQAVGLAKENYVTTEMQNSKLWG